MEIIQSPHKNKKHKKHAEMLLVDHCVEKNLLKTCSELDFYPSKKLCFDCHAVLQTLINKHLPINIGQAHDLTFRKWS